MALSSSALTAEPRSFSIGPKKLQVLSYAAISGDITGTITATALARVDSVMSISGPLAASSFSISGNVVTLTFADPVASVSGHITLMGV